MKNENETIQEIQSLHYSLLLRYFDDIDTLDPMFRVSREGDRRSYLGRIAALLWVLSDDEDYTAKIYLRTRQEAIDRFRSLEKYKNMTLKDINRAYSSGGR